MRSLVVTIVLIVGWTLPMYCQPLLQEDFDASTGLPEGWTVWNRQPFPIAPLTNWTVRDTGVVPPYIGINRTKARSLPRAIGVSWGSSIDTTGAPSTVADAWLVTKRVAGVTANHGVRFWASGGSISYLDSLQVWASPFDSTTTGMISGSYLGSIFWPVGSVFGNFTEHVFSLSAFAGQPVCWIGFRYFITCISPAGFYVHIDDVSVEQTSSVVLTGEGIPSEFDLDQNYPNPFNGETVIGFSLPAGMGGSEGTGSGWVKLAVYDVLGREVATVVDEGLVPGTYRVAFNAPGLASGTYLCRLTAGGNVQTRRMLLLK